MPARDARRPLAATLLVAALILVATRLGPLAALGMFGLRGFRWVSYALFPLVFGALWLRRPPRRGAVPDEPAPALGAAGRLALVGIAAATSFGLYAPTLGPYIHDDYDMYLVVRSHLDRAVGSIFVPGAAYSYHGLFRPLHTLSYVVDYWIWGDWRVGPHVTNLLVCGAAVYLVGLLAIRLGGSRHAALAAAVLFGLHPVHPEVAAWTLARYDALCAVWYLAALLAFLTYLESGRASRLGWSLACFVLALASKEMAGSLPLAIVALALFHAGPGGRRVRRAIRLALPYAGIMAGFFVYQILARGSLGLQDTGLSPRFVLIALISSAWWYLFYPFQEFVVGFPLRLGLVILLSLPFVALLRADLRPPAAATFVLLVVSLLPISPVMEPDPWLGQARLVYLPSAFLAIGLGLAFDRAARAASRAGRLLVRASLVGTAIGYATLSVLNTGPWVVAGRVAYALPRQARSLPSVGPGAGRIYVWGAIPAEVNPVGATLEKAFLADYWGARVEQSSGGGRAALRWVATGDAARGFWSDSQTRWFEGTLPDHFPDLRQPAGRPLGRFLLWSPHAGRVSDIGSELRRRIAAACPGPGHGGSEALLRRPFERLVLGRGQPLVRRRMDWVPSACDTLRLHLRISPPAAPHPYGNRMTLRWSGEGAPAADPALMRFDFAPVADGAIHDYDLPIGRHPRWLLLDRVVELVLDVPGYPARVFFAGAQLARAGAP